VDAALKDIVVPVFNSYNFTSAVNHRANICASPTRPATVKAILSDIWKSFWVVLCPIKLPMVARISVAMTIPSVQTKPKVVVPFFKSLSVKNSLREVKPSVQWSYVY
jgi:hypothetical protein